VSAGPAEVALSWSGSQSAPLAREDEASTRAPEELRTIGRYVVLSKIGAGGMGVVVRAYDPDLDRQVAIKVLRGHSTADARARLLREAQAMAKLSHPNVVSVFDVGLVGDQVFVAMDYIDGEDLGRWIDGGARPWREVVDVFMQAGAGLAAAHAAGLIHRDFKPDNVLLTRSAVSGRLRAEVADFGLARLGEEGPALAAEGVERPGSMDSALHHRLTGIGAVMGTPAYMSPEQHAGAPVDARTDIYSFSVALYEALYGQRPYEGATLAALAAAASGPRRPPPAGSRAPSWLHQIVLTGMQPQRERRYAQMEALLAALEAGLRRGRRRLGVGALALAGFGLTLAIGLHEPAPPLCAGGAERVATAWNEARQAAGARAFAATGAPFAEGSWDLVAARLNRYSDAWVGAYTETCAATRIRGELSESVMDLRMSCLDRRLQALHALINMFEEADPKTVTRSVDAAAELPEISACADVEALLGGPSAPPDGLSAAVEAAQGRLAEAWALLRTGKDQEALRLLGPLVAQAEQLGYAPLIVEVLIARGAAEAEGGAHERGSQTQRAALWRAIAAADDGGALAASLHLVRVVGFHLGRAEEAALWSEHAGALVRRRGDRPRERGDLLRATAAVALAAGRNDEAVALAEQGVALARAGGDAEALRLVNHLSVLGAALVRSGRYSAAEEPLTEGLALEERLRGSEHPGLVYPLSTLALVYERQARYEEAIEALRRGVTILSASSGPDHANVGLLRQNLGGMYLAAQALDDAGVELDAALRILEARLGPEHPGLAGTCTFRGDRALVMGALDEAEAEYTRAAEIRSKALGDQHPDLSLPLLGLGKVALARGAHAQAIDHLERALKNLPDEGADPGDRGLIEVALAEALWTTDRARAEALATAGLASLALAGPPVARQRAEAEAWLSRSRR
jgi:serine/threonine protein kinase